MDGVGDGGGIRVDPAGVVDRVGSRPGQERGDRTRGHALGGSEVEALVIRSRQHPSDAAQPCGDVPAEAVEGHRACDDGIVVQAMEESFSLGALLGLAPDPPVVPGHLGLDRQSIAAVAAAQPRQDLQAEIGALAVGRDADHAQGELRARQLGAIELIDVDPVGDDDDAVGGPLRLRRGELGVVRTHAHDLVDRLGTHIRQPPRLELEAMQAHDEALPLTLVA